MINKPVNLMPEHFLRDHAQQNSRRSTFKRLGIGLIILIGWSGIVYTQAADIDRKIRAANVSLHPLQQRHDEQQRLRQEATLLMDQIRLVETLREPVSAGAMIALLTQHMPDGAALVSFSLDIPAAVTDTLRWRDANSTLSDITIRLDGVAISDLPVTVLMNQLTECDLFSSVQLEEIRQIIFHNVPCHRFRILIHIPQTPSGFAGTMAGRMQP